LMPRRLDHDAAAAIMRAAGVEPYPAAGEPWLCRCLTCDREMTPRYTDVRLGHGGCKWCGWRKAGLAQRTEYEITASFMIEHGLEPLEQYRGAAEQWRCRCLGCDDELRPRFSNIKQGWGGCGRCGRLAQSRTQRGPEEEEEAIADFRAAGLEPLESYENVMTPWRSQCQRCRREVSPLLNNIRKGQGSCSWCGGNRVDAEAAVALMRAASLQPLVAYPGRNAPWSATGRCSELVTAAGAAALHTAEDEPGDNLRRRDCRCHEPPVALEALEDLDGGQQHPAAVNARGPACQYP
jgi:hypothetical protein